MTRVVIFRVQKEEKDRFHLLKIIQNLEKKINISIKETYHLDQTMKSIILESATNQSKSQIQVCAMNNVLQRIRHAAHRAEQERVRIEQR